MTLIDELEIDPDDGDLCWVRCDKPGVMTRINHVGTTSYMKLCHEHNQEFETGAIITPSTASNQWPWQKIYRLVKDNPQT